MIFNKVQYGRPVFVKRMTLAVSLAVIALVLAGINPRPAHANPTRNGWGFGIADDARADRLVQVLSGSGFRQLDIKVFRFQVPYDAADYPSLMAQAHEKIEAARNAGVQSIMVTFGHKDGEEEAPYTRPSQAQWYRTVSVFVDTFKDRVNMWGVANEPNAGRGWLRGAHTDGPCLLARYYEVLYNLLAFYQWPGSLVSPEWQDDVDDNGNPLKESDHDGSRTTVQHYIDHYTACGGGFGQIIGWHPYGGVKHRNTASTDDLLAHTPGGLPVFLTEVGSLIRKNDSCEDAITTTQQDDQVRWLVDTLANRHSRIQRVYYYHQRPPGGCTWDSGLEDSAGNFRPSWWTYCRATHDGPCTPCTGVGCDDGNACTDDVCNAGQCTHTFAARCLSPILSLLLDGEGECDGSAACADGDGCCPAGCAGIDDDCTVPPHETPIKGTRLLIRDAANPQKREIALTVSDPSIDTTLVDPATDGLSLRVYNQATGEVACLNLPATPGAWRATGSPPTFKYRDARYANGPCSLATMKRGGLLLKCRATVQPIPYTLDEPSQGSVNVDVSIGDRRLCAYFGGRITADSGTNPPISGGRGKFWAKLAPAPDSCPATPPPCS